jgi:hypothetical protein
MPACMEIPDILKESWRDINHTAGPLAEVLGPGVRPLQQVLLLPRDLDITAPDQAVCLDEILREGGGHCCQASWKIHSNNWSAADSSVGRSRQGRTIGWSITGVVWATSQRDSMK